MSKKSFIDSIEVKSPCSEDWNEMKGSGQTRFCGHCAKDVNNISALTRKQAMRVVRDAKGEICVRYVKNPKTNAPVFAGKLYHISRRAGLAAGVLGASLSLSTLTYAQAFRSTEKPQIEDARLNELKDVKTESATASVSGTVRDPNDAVIPGMTVTLFSMRTRESRVTVTDESGFYNFENVADGYYKIKTSGESGFAEKEFFDIRVSEGINISKDLSLSVNEIVVSGGAMFISYANPLVTAVSNDDIEEVRNLIAKGENVNGKDENYDNITPLFTAVENGNVEIAETLLNFGAKINARDKTRQTPLMRLDSDATVELALLLIKHGAKVNQADNEGDTALILAAGESSAEVLQVLIDYKADINAQNKQGQTALMNAANEDKLESVRALILAGANVNLKNKEGETAWDLTSNAEIEQLLESHGAIVKED